jgi:diamine N-acetyltransferase
MTILLRVAEPSDIAFIMECERRPDYERFVGRWPEEKHRAFMAHPEFTYLVANEDGAPLGFAILHEWMLRPQNLYLKRIAVHDTDKGHGRRMLSALNDWVFAETETHRFWLEVVEHNLRAQHVYEQHGFVTEGIVREGYEEDDGTRGSFVQMSLLKSDWLKRRGDAA